MTLRPRPLSRSTLVSLLLFSSLFGAVVLACSSDDGASNGGTPPGGSTGPDGSAAVRDGGADSGYDDGPVTPKEFPLDTPALGGYTLVDAFPNAEALDIPSAIAWAKTDTANAHPFVLERTGVIRRLADDGTWDYDHPVVDFSAKVNVQGEGGAVGMVLHPKFGDGSGHDYIYVWYNACAGSTGGPFGCGTYSQKLERYTFHSATNTADSPLLMIEEGEQQNIHNAGKMLFGADGYLYFSNGDDGDDGAYDNHQTVSNAMFAGIFRIDVDGLEAKPGTHNPLPHTRTTPVGALYHRAGCGLPDLPTAAGCYRIPDDNPWQGNAANVEEFYAMGFRNPYSWSFDKQTGDLWEGDVGDSFREEVNHIVKGGNYQWPIKEGELTNLAPDRTVYLPGTGTGTPPVFASTHAEIADLSSIFGGIVYRGPSLPDLAGKYVYTDWISNRIWAIDLAANPPARTLLISSQYKSQPMGWNQDNAGEVYLIQYGPSDQDGDKIHGGHVKKIAKDTSLDGTPKRLKGTFLFTDVPNLVPAADLVPYTVSSPLWSDGAVKKRWIKVPAGQKISIVSGTNTTMDGTFKYPVGTMFIKQFDLAADIDVANRTRHLETRVMVVGNDTTYGYTFRWRPDGSDADLVANGQDETLVDATTGAQRNWHYPGPDQCWGCHRNGWEDDANTIRNEKYRILGFTPAQLGGTVAAEDGGSSDLRAALLARGLFDDAATAALNATPVLPTPSDGSGAHTIAQRAFSYLAANCSPCHHEYAGYTGGGQTWIATYGAGSISARHMDTPANNYPMTVRLAVDRQNEALRGGNLIVPNAPDDSVLLQRILTNDPDLRMPPIARNVPDPTGADVVRQWIQAGAPAN